MKDNILITDQVKALEKWVQFIIKSFWYQEKLSVKLAELEFYITKLAKATGFDLRYLYKATYQGQILK